MPPHGVASSICCVYSTATPSTFLSPALISALPSSYSCFKITGLFNYFPLLLLFLFYSVYSIILCCSLHLYSGGILSLEGDPEQTNKLEKQKHWPVCNPLGRNEQQHWCYFKWIALNSVVCSNCLKTAQHAQMEFRVFVLTKPLLVSVFWLMELVQFIYLLIKQISLNKL